MLFSKLPYIYILSPSSSLISPLSSLKSLPRNSIKKKYSKHKEEEEGKNPSFMAVDTRHVNHFLPQLIPNRELYSNQGNLFTGFNNNNGGQLNPLGVAVPALADGVMLPLHQSLICEPKTSINTESGLTCNNNLQSAPRKRSRDDNNNCEANDFACPPQKINSGSNSTLISPFIGQDLLPQLQQHQLEIDSIISQHAKKMRIEIEERQKQSARIIVQALGEGLVNKMKEKDEQIQRMGKLNLILQERLKSLYVENQLWRDLAQTNEATANSLRTNLEQVLAHVSEEPRFSAGGCAGGAVVEEDVQSCCGSSDDGKGEEEEVEGGVRRRVAAAAEHDEGRRVAQGGAHDSRKCRGCGERESCVLLLPCRHLCLCTVCGSSLLQTCPVCNSNMNATVHVNMSSS